MRSATQKDFDRATAEIESAKLLAELVAIQRRTLQLQTAAEAVSRTNPQGEAAARAKVNTAISEMSQLQAGQFGRAPDAGTGGALAEQTRVIQEGTTELVKLQRENGQAMIESVQAQKKAQEIQQLQIKNAR